MTTLQPYDSTAPTPSAIGHDQQGFFVDMRWLQAEVVTIKVHRDASPAETLKRKKVEERVYCTQEELIAFAKELGAHGCTLVGQIPPRSRAEAENWGATISGNGKPWDWLNSYVSPTHSFAHGKFWGSR